ncbi:hypothetical protein [Caminibacter sp.]
MKKLLFLILVISGLFAERYPLAFEYGFMKGCVGKENNPTKEKYCICAISYIEQKYTLNQFISALQDPEKKMKIIKSAVNYCLTELKKEK